MVEKLERAEELGILKPHWRFIDYCLDAAPNQKWLSAIIWGEKGNGKSDLLLQHGYAVFHGFDAEIETEGGFKQGIIQNWRDVEAWKTTLEHIVFRPRDFDTVLDRALEQRKRLSWVGWDDINIHLPRSMYSTDRKRWEAYSTSWEGMRSNFSIFECTAPRKDKVASFVLADMSWDILCSGRQATEYSRWYWDKDFYEPEKVNKYRIDTEKHVLTFANVPQEIWDEYWKRKTMLNDEHTVKFKQMLQESDAPTNGILKKQPKECQYCHKVMNEWNLKTHEPICKLRPLSTLPHV